MLAEHTCQYWQHRAVNIGSPYLSTLAAHTCQHWQDTLVNIGRTMHLLWTKASLGIGALCMFVMLLARGTRA